MRAIVLLLATLLVAALGQAASPLGPDAFESDSLVPRVESLPLVVRGMSPDGLTLVGLARETASHAAIWRDGSLRALAAPARDPIATHGALALSRDGAIVVGLAGRHGEHARPFRWDLEGARFVDDATGVLVDVSWNGRVAAGAIHDARGQRVAALWRGRHRIPLEWGNGFRMTEVYGLSARGDALVGAGASPEGLPGLYHWRRGRLTRLEGPPGGHLAGGTPVLSDDGSTVVHASLGAGDHSEAWRWRNGRLEPLGFAHPHHRDSTASSVSANGHVVGGSSGDGDMLAVLWDRAGGMRPLADILEELGVDVTALALESVVALSADARRLVGRGRDESGATRHYLVILPPACADSLDNDGDGRVDYPDDPDCRDLEDGGEGAAR